MLPWQVRDALRASIKEAARAAASSASKGSSVGTPLDGSLRASTGGGSGLLWSLLRNCLRQQGEALIDLHASKAAARDTEQQLLKVTWCRLRQADAGTPPLCQHQARCTLHICECHCQELQIARSDGALPGAPML